MPGFIFRVSRLMLCCVSLFILGNLCKVRKFVQPVAEVYVYGSRINNRDRLESIPVDSVLPDLVLGEKTKYGWHLLPDNAHGFGPIYMAVLEKVHYP
jgi:hypothetical protein